MGVNDLPSNQVCYMPQHPHPKNCYKVHQSKILNEFLSVKNLGKKKKSGECLIGSTLELEFPSWCVGDKRRQSHRELMMPCFNDTLESMQ